VTQSQLYEPYAIEEIVSFFGAPGEAQSFCNGQWLIFARTAICLASVGKGPKISFFENPNTVAQHRRVGFKAKPIHP
jgi:hypothetical protein